MLVIRLAGLQDKSQAADVQVNSAVGYRSTEELTACRMLSRVVRLAGAGILACQSRWGDKGSATGWQAAYIDLMLQKRVVAS